MQITEFRWQTLSMNSSCANAAMTVLLSLQFIYAAVCDINFIAESVVPVERKGLDGKDEGPKPFDDCAICAFALQNIQRIFPLLAPMIINTYRIPSCLFIDGESIMSREGVIQGDPLAMAFYAIATIP